MKIKKREILKIIQEEMQSMRRQAFLNERKSSATSRKEIEELLGIYAQNVGGLPDNISQLSVLFPILERSGLQEIVDDYIETAKVEGREAAVAVLEPVKQAIINIRQKPANPEEQ